MATSSSSSICTSVAMRGLKASATLRFGALGSAYGVECFELLLAFKGRCMPSYIRISAKNLGALALPSFCPRCFWIQMHAEGGLPYQIFLGIFSSIDFYGNKLAHGWFARHGSAPPWLASLGNIKGYRPPPHYSKFQVLDPEASVLLTGTPDGV